jgi:hypothetical protein
VPFASLPDPSSPGFPAIASFLMGFVGTSYGFWRGMPRDEVQWAGFFGAYLGVALGLLIYMATLVSEL